MTPIQVTEAFAAGIDISEGDVFTAMLTVLLEINSSVKAITRSLDTLTEALK